MRNSGFRQQSLEEIKEKQAIKREKMLSKPKVHKPRKKLATRRLGGNKRKPKSNLKKLKAQLWELCKQVTRKRYQNQDGTWHCYTCGKLIDIPAKAQTGHGIPSSVGGILLRYHLDNLRIQCYNCNINKSGNWPAYLENLTKEIGKDGVDSLLEMRRFSTKADVIWFENKIKEYAEIFKCL